MRKLQRSIGGIDALYVLLDSHDKIMAVSEDEMMMSQYVVQFSDYFGKNGSCMYAESDRQKIEKLLIRGEMMVLQPLSHFVFTEMECVYYNAIFAELYENYKTAVGELISMKKLIKWTMEESDNISSTILTVVEKLKSYEQFLDELDVAMVSEHILVKPYMAKFYYNELNQLKQSFSYQFGRE